VNNKSPTGDALGFLGIDVRLANDEPVDVAAASPAFSPFDGQSQSKPRAPPNHRAGRTMP
jgi:hypothetical protein